MKRLIFPFLVILIGFFTSSCIAIPPGRVVHNSEHLLETNGEFETLWTISDFHVSNNNIRPMIVGAPGQIIAQGFRNRSVFASTMGLDSTTGEILWQTQQGSDGDSIIINDNVLYRGTAGTAKICAYDIESGELIWETLLPWAHSVIDLYAADNKLFVYTNDSDFFVLDEQGDIVDSFRDTSRVFLKMEGVLFIYDAFSIKAVEQASSNEIWHVELDDRINHAPVFNHGKIFLDTWANPSSIYSIDQSTGEVDWQISQDVLSNLYITETKIYFLGYSDDGYLVTLDRTLGSEVSRVKFTPAFDLYENSYGYFITGDAINNMIAVSFGDNYQITGFKIINP